MSAKSERKGLVGTLRGMWRGASFFIVAFVVVAALTNSPAQDAAPPKDKPAATDKEAPAGDQKPAESGDKKDSPKPAAEGSKKKPAADKPAEKADEKAPAEAMKPEKREINSTVFQRLRSVIGLLILVGFCFAVSKNRSHVSVRVVVVGLLLQLFMGFIVLKTAVGAALFGFTNDIVVALLGYSNKGAELLFGKLTDWTFANASFAFSVLPTIIFFSAFMTVLYHLGVMQFVVKILARGMQATMGTSGAETLSAAGNIFVGQTEAPLLIKPYVNDMTESELMAVMTGGFATVAGGVMAAYVSFLKAYFPDIAGHLLTASVMSAPAALVCAKIMVPEVDPTSSKTYGKIEMPTEKLDANVIDAAARGASEGLTLALNVGAMLLAFTALVYLGNDVVAYLCKMLYINAVFGVEDPINVTYILGKLLSPVAWIMGVEWADCEKVGTLLGQKTVLNEFFAYNELAVNFKKDPNFISPRSMLITTYALCGFANFASIAIQVGGISVIAPDRRHDLAKLGFRAMVAGTLAAFMTGTVAGLIA